MNKIAGGVPRLVKAASSKGFRDAAEAILTTDLVTKHVAVEFTVGRKKVRMAAMAKGSGMIRPDMATMLAFITTDAVIRRSFMKKVLRNAVNESFNRITVDGDMSTNDTVLMLANGTAGNSEITEKKSGAKLQDALVFVCRTLARKIVEDGEGATKYISVRVERAPSRKAAETAARAIADSPLVKTAIYGESPNWGRAMAAIGSSGVRFNPGKLSVFINGLQVVESGARAKYDEAKARSAMRRKKIDILVDLASGRSAEEIWTCDLSRRYVEINV
jgi:glutamate N-acetyltransferase/amino-acid N-acetyltransferase